MTRRIYTRVRRLSWLNWHFNRRRFIWTEDTESYARRVSWRRVI